MKTKEDRKTSSSATIAFTLLVIAACSQNTLAQWATNGNNINNTNTGNVGIGTTSPATKLDISTSGNTLVNVTSTGANNLAQIQLIGRTASANKSWYISSRGGSDSPNNRLSFFDTGVVERVTFADGGNVGIGTTAPVTLLEVSKGQNAATGARITNSSAGTAAFSFLQTTADAANGYLYTFSSSYTTNNLYVADGTTLEASADASGGLNLLANASNGVIRFGAGGNTERMRIDSSGRVGIGTTNPTHPLTIKAASGTFGILLNNNSETYSLSYLGPRGSSGNALSQGYFQISNLGSAAVVLDSAGSSYFTGGNVGIGTTTPGYKLDVAGTMNATGLNINGSPITSSQWTTNGANINYATGNVGIGTTSPSYKLEINGGTWNNSLGLVSSNTVGVGAILQSTDTGGHQYSILSTGTGNTPGAGTLSIYDSTAAAYRFVLNGSGNVGIGTTSPQSNLQIGTQTSLGTASPTTLSLGATYSSTAGANFKLKLYDDGVAGETYGIGVSNGSMDFGVFSSAGYHWYVGGVNKMTLTNTGDLSVSGNIAAKYQDVAEWVPSSEQLAVGTVVVLDVTKSNQVVTSTQAYDTRVAGVISDQPGITLGERGDNKVLVATTGRVRVKVDASRAPIHIGDLLVTSDIPGVAMKSEPVNVGGIQLHRPGTLIGKALEPLEKGTGTILVLLSLQ